MNMLLLVWGSHLRNTRGWERGTFFATDKKTKNLKISNLVCQPYLRIFPYGQFPPKIPGPVSQTKLKTKKYGGDAVLKKKTLLIN